MPTLTAYPIDKVPNLKLHGRTIPGANPLPIFWNHAGVEVNCDGSELWLDVEVDCDVHEPWIAIEINGKLIARQMLLPGAYGICCFRSMTPGIVKNVKVYRELQAMSEDERCHLLIRSVRCDGQLLPVAEPRCKLEFIGDSITSGEGTYGATEDTDWIAMYMSTSRHYANLISRMLDADIRIVSQGGWGVYCGWDNDIRHNIPSIYEKVCAPADGETNRRLGAQDEYDFAGWQPDAVIVNLGTNDCSAFRQPAWTDPATGVSYKQHLNPDGSFAAEDIRKVEDAAVAFLKTLRGHYPKALLVWTYGMLGYDLTLPLTRAVSRFRDETGDANAVFLNVPDTRPQDYGSHMHPGFACHVRAAEVLTDYLSRTLGIKAKELAGNL